MKHEEIYAILTEANQIVDGSLDPTPIRPEGVRVVKEVLVTETDLYKDNKKDGTLYNLLRSLVHKRRSEEMGPVQRMSSSCFDDMRTAIDISDPSSKMRFRDMGDEQQQHMFLATKRRKTNPLSQHAAVSFANIFDHESNVFSEQQAPAEQATIHKISSLTTPLLLSRDSIKPQYYESPSEAELRFREYQSTRWYGKFEELKKSFHDQKHGLCHIGWKENPLLAQWIKRQRYQYKLKLEGRHSTMTDERVASLEGLGFSWDSHRAAWEEKFNELVLFKAEHGHCSVPSTFPENRQLSIWVKGQRRHFKLFQTGNVSAMDADRTAKLNDIGFCWSLRNVK
jgi:hypothetical protein